MGVGAGKRAPKRGLLATEREERTPRARGEKVLKNEGKDIVVVGGKVYERGGLVWRELL